jgi:hypothetical protein
MIAKVYPKLTALTKFNIFLFLCGYHKVIIYQKTAVYMITAQVQPLHKVVRKLSPIYAVESSHSTFGQCVD